ncbi:PAS domain-containing sensor histidine kinase [Rubripirellula tenax]|uniref:PAS domain-containing sensor histidine kinase n=1 Tax=Rubripirellula tenax TaxID=2528015 RepID=UPI001648769E|nr:PAS domain S-box protein [Rubripirellula tenax]
MNRHDVNVNFLVIAGVASMLLFASDCILNSEFVFSVLYFLPVLLAAWSYSRNGVLVIAGICTALTGMAWALASRGGIDQSSHAYHVLSIVAVWCTALFSSQVPRLQHRKGDLQNQLSAASGDLEASEEKMRLIAASALDAVITVNEQGSVTGWNHQAEVIFGRSAEDVSGQQLADLIIPESLRGAHHDGLSHFLKTGHGPMLNQRMETTAQRVDGSVFPVELSIVALELRSGYEFCAFVRDISVQKATLAELQDRELHNRVLLNSTAEGIYGLDMQGNCTFANPASAALLGYGDPEQFLGRNMHELIHHTCADGKANPQESCRIYQAFRMHEGVHVDDEVFWRKDGSSFPVEYWSHPVIRDGELIGSVLTFIDITERHVMQTEQLKLKVKLQTLVRQRTADLDQTRERLELALTGANVGLWDWNPQTSKVYYSPTFKSQLGHPPEADWDDFAAWESRLHPADHASAIACVESYFARTTQAYKSIFRMRCLSGSYRWILAQGTANFGADGKPIRMTGVHVDITDQVAAEQELKRVNEALAIANEALQESNEELQQFAYVASHDLQAPLRAISGFSQFLERDYRDALDERGHDYLDRIVRGVKRMQRLINDLLDYSRVESRAAPFQSVSLNDIYEDAVELLAESIREADAIVTCGELPSVDADPAQVSQLLTNLIGNAIKYNRNQPRVQITATRQPDEWVLSIEDNGIGIDSQFYQQIFDVFRRLHTRDEYAGTGIGLAICRRITKRHGWKLHVTSEIDKGSKFCVTIPDSPSVPNRN